MGIKETIRLQPHSTRHVRKTRVFANKCDLYGNWNEVHGRKNLVQGDHCTVIGDYCTVIGNYCKVIGKGNTIIGDHNESEGDENEHIGNHNTAHGKGCTCQGESNVYNGSRVNMQDVRLPSKSHVDEAATGDSDACAVCLLNKKCCAAMPCRHMCLCVACSHGLARDANKIVCPVCRTPLEEIMLMF